MQFSKQVRLFAPELFGAFPFDAVHLNPLINVLGGVHDSVLLPHDFKASPTHLEACLDILHVVCDATFGWWEGATLPARTIVRFQLLYRVRCLAQRKCFVEWRHDSGVGSAVEGNLLYTLNCDGGKEESSE